MDTSEDPVVFENRVLSERVEYHGAGSYKFAFKVLLLGDDLSEALHPTTAGLTEEAEEDYGSSLFQCVRSIDFRQRPEARNDNVTTPKTPQRSATSAEVEASPTTPSESNASKGWRWRSRLQFGYLPFTMHDGCDVRMQVWKACLSPLQSGTPYFDYVSPKSSNVMDAVILCYDSDRRETFEKTKTLALQLRKTNPALVLLLCQLTTTAYNFTISRKLRPAAVTSGDQVSIEELRDFVQQHRMLVGQVHFADDTEGAVATGREACHAVFQGLATALYEMFEERRVRRVQEEDAQVQASAHTEAEASKRHDSVGSAPPVGYPPTLTRALCEGPPELNSVTADPSASRFHWKLLLLGPPGVGKSCFLSRYVDHLFLRDYVPSERPEFAVTTVRIDGQHISSCKIWDVPYSTLISNSISATSSSQQQQQRYHTSPFVGIAGAVLLFDLTSRSSFAQVTKDGGSTSHSTRDSEEGGEEEEEEEEGNIFLRRLQPDTNRKIILLVGTKSDLAAQREVSTSEALAWATFMGMTYIEVSHLTGENVSLALFLLCEAIFDETCRGVARVRREYHVMADVMNFPPKSKAKIYPFVSVGSSAALRLRTPRQLRLVFDLLDTFGRQEVTLPDFCRWYFGCGCRCTCGCSLPWHGPLYGATVRTPCPRASLGDSVSADSSSSDGGGGGDGRKCEYHSASHACPVEASTVCLSMGDIHRLLCRFSTDTAAASAPQSSAARTRTHINFQEFCVLMYEHTQL